MRNPEVMDERGDPEHLSGLFYKDNSTVIAIQDATEESVTGSDLAANLNKLRLIGRFSVNRETAEYARLIMTDPFGRTHYFRAWK